MNELIVNGTVLETQDFENEQSDSYTLSKVIDVSQNRGDNPQSISYDDNDVVEIQFDDGTVWITPANKIQDAFEKSNRGTQVGRYVIPNALEVSTNERGLIKIFVKIVKFFKVKEIKKGLGIFTDKKIMEKEGLFRIHNFENKVEAKDLLPGGHYLLFIHGFISNYDDAFDDIFTPCETYNKNSVEVKYIEEEHKNGTVTSNLINQKYGKKILAYNHKTISKSPIQNAKELLDDLPEGCTLDIIAHSRGGLIADLLSICGEYKNDNFTTGDIERFSKDQGQWLRELRKLSKEKKISVNKIIRAGSPMNGTYLLSKNLDQFLSAVFALVELSTKGAARASKLYNLIKEFTISVAGSRSNPDIFPGVAAMVPGAPLLQMLNDTSRVVSTPLFAMEGNAEIGRNLIHSLSVILGNILHRRANDFIVNTNSMRFGIFRQNGVYVCDTKDSCTTHFNYFCHKKSSNALLQAIRWESESDNLPCFSYFNRDELILQFEKQFKSLRSGELAIDEDALVVIDQKREETLLDKMFGVKNQVSENTFSSTIKVRLVHGDLEFAEYPVMAGHFGDQAIVSAEKAINRSLGNKLEDHYLLGKYPDTVEDNIVIYDQHNNFKGCILVGLGDAMDFNGYKLRKAVENGVVSFALHMRNNHSDFDVKSKSSISTLCIGSGFGGLNMDASLTAILFGIHNANKRIYDFNRQQIERGFNEMSENNFLTPISELEIIELYEHKARDAFYGLHRIKELRYHIDIDIPDKITSYHGGLKELNTDKTQSYWYDLIVRRNNNIAGVNGKMTFLAYQGGARVSESIDFYSLELVNKLLASYALKSNFDEDLSNSLFQLLLPRSLRSMLRGQHNIVLKMDKDSARIPWEMIHDKDSDNVPSFVSSGLVRQLITSRVMPSEKTTRDLHALIIGDPIYTKYNQLAGAKEEAIKLKSRFENLNHWKVTSHIGKGYVENAQALLNLKYKVLHICGHGIYDPITQRTGLVMEDSLLDTVFFNNLENIPEMAFINCCYSGTTDKEYEDLYENRYEISASIGVQLIEMGVQAVIVTGWAVDDAAALAFSEQFYFQMLNGEKFGMAAKNARRHIYDHYSNKTWAAYQCYGNPWYSLVHEDSKSHKELEFNTQEEVYVELNNMQKQLFQKRNSAKNIEKLNEILTIVRDKWPTETGLFVEVAWIYFEMDENDLGSELMEEIFKMENADYQVRAIERYIYAKLKGIKIRKLDEAKKVPSNEEIIQEVTTRIEDLIKIHDTSDRYCFKGLLCMRQAMISTGKKYNDRLLAMKNNFYLAFQKRQEIDAKQSVFPLMMYAFARYNEEDNRFEKVTYLDTEYEIKKLFEKLKEDVLAMPKEKNNFWSDIALINIDTSLLILSNYSDFNAIEDQQEKILVSYKLEFKRSGTFRNLRAEIDQFEFLDLLLTRIVDRKRRAKKLSRDAEKSFEKKIASVKLILNELNLLGTSK